MRIKIYMMYILPMISMMTVRQNRFMFLTVNVKNVNKNWTKLNAMANVMINIVLMVNVTKIF